MIIDKLYSRINTAFNIRKLLYPFIFTSGFYSGTVRNGWFIKTFVPKVIYDRFSNRGTVSILRLQGRITSSNSPGVISLQALDAHITKAFNIRNLKVVCLIVNSPGGSAVQSELIAKKIILLGRQKNVPVFSFVEDIAASGGYWLACAGENIFVCDNSMVGSIGVIHMAIGLSKLFERIGIEPRVYATGDMKSLMNPLQETTNEHVQSLKSQMNQMNSNFQAFIKTRRNDKLSADNNMLFSGNIWIGQQAIDLGLADGKYDNVELFIKERFGDNVKFIMINRGKQNLLVRLFQSIYNSLIEM